VPTTQPVSVEEQETSKDSSAVLFHLIHYIISYSCDTEEKDSSHNIIINSMNNSLKYKRIAINLYKKCHCRSAGVDQWSITATPE